MSDIVSPLLQWLNANPEWAGVATFVISAAESVAIIGTIVPGSITMTAIGTLAGAGVIPLWARIIWAILGAVIGDGISYWIGHYFKDRLRNSWPFRNSPGVLLKAEKFVHKYGVMSVFIGRFVGPVRALVPLVAGMLGMRPLQFTIANVTSAIGWAPAYMLPGILLGAASLELPPDIALHVILVLMLIFLFLLLCLWFLYKLFQLIQNQILQLQDWIWQRLKKSRYLSPLTVLLKYHNSNKPHGQLVLAFFFIITSLLFLWLALYVKAVGADHITVNNAMYHLFRGLSIRSERLDSLMINITLLGQKQIILPVVMVIFAWLIIWKRWRAAFHALSLGVLAAGSVFVIKNLLQSPRPWGIFQSTESFSMPSGHTTLATTVYIGFAFLIASAIPPKRRWPVYTLAVLVTLAVGISRLYLGAHWFTDVISAWLLSAALLMLVIISYQRQTEQPVRPIGISLVSLFTLCVTYGVYHHLHFTQMKMNYTQLNWPTVVISLKAWWQKNAAVPAYKTSLFGFPSQEINIEWVGDINQIRDALLKAGWSKPPARDWISTLHRLADIRSTEYLPMVSPQYLDKKPALILTRQVNHKRWLVIRLWDAHRVMRDSGATLWVGFVADVPRTYSWIWKKDPGILAVDPTLVFPTKIVTADWQWKILMASIEEGETPYNQQMLLIRKNQSAQQKI